MDPSPELSDPIYSDLLSRHEAAKRDAEKTEKELEAAKKQFELAQVQTGEAKVRRGQVEDLISQLTYKKQYEHYLEVSIQSRKEADQKSYLKAFESDKDWPDPEEFQSYKVHKRLVESPKSWDEHLAQMISQRKPTNKASEKKGEGEHGKKEASGGHE